MTIIKIPDDLANEIDHLAGGGHRSAFAISILWREIRRNKQLAALRATSGCWKSEDHPELSQGAAAYIEAIRSEPDERFEQALKQHLG